MLQTPKSQHFTRHIFGILAIGLAILIYHRAAAQTPTPISACGDVSGSVILSADLTTTSGVCLTVTAANTSIDGNGHTVTVSGGVNDWAVLDTNHANLTVTNISSGQGVYLSGSSDTISITNSTLGNVTVAGADDVTIDHNTLQAVSVYADGADIPYRTTLTNNTIASDNEVLVDFNGDNATTCPTATAFVVTGNTITSSYQCGGSGQPACNEPKALFMRCGSGNTVFNNIIRTTGQAMPGRFRDAFDDSTINDNTFWASGDLSPDGAFGAFNITSGNVGKHYPQNNTITRNIMRADQSVAMWLQVEGTNNTFSYNYLYANSDQYVAGIFDAPSGNSYMHNTFYNAGSGLAVTLGFRNSDVDLFRDNIFDYQGASVYGYDGWDFSRYQGDFNLFHNRSGSVSFGAYGGSLAEWQTNAAPDDAASLEADPQFTNAASLDFSLQIGSAALNAASDGTNMGAWQSAACTESWTCGDWSSCSNSVQTRVCTDAYSCGTTVNRPALSQSCDSTAPAAVNDLQAH